MQENARVEKKPSAKQIKLIGAIIAGNSILAAAKLAECDQATAHAWLKLEHVKKALNEARQEVFSETIALLKTDMKYARNVILKVMADEEVPPGTRLRAAQLIWEQGMNVHSNEELVKRIEAIEQLGREQDE